MLLDVRAEDLRACEEILDAGSKSFATAARLLPRGVRMRATILYAFCRVADDVIDAQTTSTDAALTCLRERLDRAYAGTPKDDPLERAFSALVREERMPRLLFEALIEGFAWDVQGRRYETLAEVQAYAARVAASVGAMMTLVMGERRSLALARACDLGVAMQLTNIARDVGEDAMRGRIYLPTRWLTEAGLDVDAWLAAPKVDARVSDAVARLLREADALYTRSDRGIPMLPRACRIAIRAARLIYSEIGTYVARAKFDSVSQRAVVPSWRKVWLLLRAVAVRFAHSGDDASPPLEATRHLVIAAAGDDP